MNLTYRLGGSLIRRLVLSQLRLVLLAGRLIDRLVSFLRELVLLHWIRHKAVALSYFWCLSREHSHRADGHTLIAESTLLHVTVVAFGTEVFVAFHVVLAVVVHDDLRTIAVTVELCASRSWIWSASSSS